MKKWFYSLMLALTLSACAHGADSPSLKGSHFESVVDGVTITLFFDAKEPRAFGKVVNRYTSPYELNGNQITFKQAATTMMMPFGKAAEVEQNYFRFLNEVRTFDLKEDTLILRDSSGKEMKFQRVNRLPG